MMVKIFTFKTFDSVRKQNVKMASCSFVGNHALWEQPRSLFLISSLNSWQKKQLIKK